MKKITTVLAFLLISFLSFSQTVIYQEGFETLPLSVTSSGNPGWSRSGVYHKTGNYSDSSRVAASDTSYLTTNSFSTLGNSYVVLEFAQICKIEFFDAAVIEVSTNNGISWTKLLAAQYLGAGQFGTQGDKFTAASYTIWDPGTATTIPQNAWWKNETFDISSVASNQANVKIRFKLYDGNNTGHANNYGWLLDDIKVTVATSELVPPVVALQAPVVQDTIYTTTPYEIIAQITDNSGIDTAYITYSINGGAAQNLGMTLQGNNIYHAYIPSQSYNTHVDYQVFAVDASPAANIGQSTAKWFYVKKGPDIVTIGTGTTVNGTSGYPAPYGNYYWGSRHQMMIKASELIAAGVTAGEIVSVGFDVVTVGGAALTGFTMKIGQTTQNDMSTWVGNLTQVYTAASFTDVVGWNTHTFTQPFIWNGTSNLVIETCFNNASWTSNALMNQSATSYISTLTYNTDASGVCASTNTSSNYSQRPNIRLGLAPNTNDYDAGIFQIIEPTGTVLSGVAQNVNVRVKNFGLQTLTTAQIGWSVNGVAQTPVPWNGSLTQDQISNPFYLGQYTFLAGPYTVKAWTYNPNGNTDQKFVNDTATSSVYACNAILNGSYTVGGVSADFPTMADALTALQLCGVSGPVVLNLNPGNYPRIVVPQVIPGISATNTVTFKGKGANTTINYSTTVSNDRAAIVMNNIKHVRFDSLYIVIPDTATYGWGIFMTNQCENIQIKNCNIKTSVTSTSSNHCGIVASGSYTSATTTGNTVKDLLLSNNTIDGGYYGVSIIGESANKTRNIQLNQNAIKNVYYYGLYMYYGVAPVITKNSIETRISGSAFTTSSYGMYLSTIDSTMTITKNKLKNLGNYGVYLTSCTNASTPSVVANNMIGGFGNTGTPNGIYIGSSSNIAIIYNSINVNSGAGYPINALSTAAQLSVLNNSFAYTGTGNGYAAYYASTASLTAHNYNNYFKNNSTNFVYYGVAVANLAALKAVNVPVGNDTSSKVGNPNYATPTSLYPSGTQLWNSGTPIPTITDDIDGALRSVTSPCIGAVEYTPPANDAGLMAVVVPLNSECALTSTEDISLRIKNFGTATMTSVNATYKLNNNTPVTETFTVNIPMDSVQEITFVTKANLSAPGIYNFDFWVNKTGDINQLNDSIKDYKVYHSHNFYNGAYTQSFEPTEYFADWSVFNPGGGTTTWVIPYNNVANAYTGSNSAQFVNGTTNTGNDWLFSRCFDFVAGATYQIDFYYQNGSATTGNNIELKMGTQKDTTSMTTSLLTLTGILNTAYLKATKTFTVPVTGVYYFGWKTFSTPTATNAYIDNINVKLIPPTEASLIAIPKPVPVCGMGTDTIAITIMNSGTDTLNTTLNASYQVNGGNVVTETVTLTNLPPNQSYVYNFTTLYDFSTTNVNTLFNIKAWIALNNDPFAFNDTLINPMLSTYIPADPVASDVDINYGQQATLNATSQDTLLWFSTQNSQTVLFTGNPYITPVLFDTTTYWVEAQNVILGQQKTVGTGTTNTYQIPTNGFYNYSWSASIYKASELGNFVGTIDTLMYDVNSTHTTPFTMLNQNIYFALTTDSVFATADKPNPANMTLVYSGPINWTGPGWFKLPLQTTFNSNGTSNLIIYWENWDAAYVSGYPYFNYHTGNTNCTKYTQSDTGFPTGAGTQTTMRPHIKITHSIYYCNSNRVPVTANVIMPAAEAELVDIITPLDKTCTDGTEPITITIKNNGSQTITSGLTASYTLNNGTPVNEAVTTPIPSGGSINFTFTTPITVNLTSGDTTIDIVCYVNHAGDPYQANDTAETTVTLIYTPAQPTATSPVTIPYGTTGNLTATSPHLMTWFDVPTGGVALTSGANYTTPILYDTTTYYVEASTLMLGQQTTVGTGTSSSYQQPTNGLWDYSWSGSIYKANELNFSGAIDTIMYNISNTITSFPMLDQRIYMMLTNDSAFNTTDKPDPSTMTQVYSGTINWTGPGWFKLPLQTPFNYDGTSHLIIYWESWDADYTSGYPSFYYTIAQTNASKYNYADGAFPSGAGSLTSNRPNVRFSHSIMGCTSDRTPIQVNISNFPNNDAGIVSVDAPTSPTGFGSQNIDVTLKNYGLNNLTNVTINWTVNGTPQLAKSWNGSLANGQTESVNIGTYNFTLGYHDFKVWTTAPNGAADIYNLNDTANKTIQSYEPLHGVYTVGGTTPDFANFTAARNALIEYGVSAPVIFKVRNGIYNEKLFLPAFAGASATNTVTFMPDTNATVTLTASDTFALKIINATYYIFDGSNNGTTSQDFNIINTSTNTNTAAVWLAGGNNFITIKNCKINAGTNTATSTFAIHAGGAAISTSSTGSNNNVLIENNILTKAYYGAYVKAASNQMNTNLVIKNNIIGSTNNIEYILYRGVDLQGATAPLVEGNTIMNMQVSSSVNVSGVEIGSDVVNAKITKNKISGLRSTSTSGYGAYGVNINSSTNVTDIEISNNFIWDIVTAHYSVTSTLWNPFGIRITGGTGHKIWHNSINLYGAPTNGTSPSMSACLIVTSSAATGLDVRNNVFANSMTGLPGSKEYAIYITSPASFNKIDYNDYYTSGTYGILGFSGAADITTLPAWKLVTVKDTNSLSVNPCFLTDNNLHTFATSVNGKATPITSVTDDIDGQVRNATTPDMGADEYDPLNYDLGIIAVLSPASNCGLDSNTVIIVNVKNNGQNPITAFTLSYTLNGGAPVSQTFNGNLGTDSVYTFTFTTTANMYALASYTLFFQATLTGDQYALNDTLTQYLSPLHNFANAYTMGFEAAENYNVWSSLNVLGDASRWVFPYNSTTYAHTGTNSAQFLNSTTNTGNDWMFSPCFRLESGKTYKVEFWYRAQSATYTQNLKLMYGTDKTPVAMTDTVVVLAGFNNTGYLKASGIINITTTGTYFFGWHAYSTASSYYMYVDDINIKLLAPKDAGVVEMVNITPIMNGGDVVNLQAKLKNFGGDTLLSIPVKYSLNGGTPVTETWMGTLPPDCTVVHNFSTAFNCPTNQFDLCAWTQLTNDGNTANDTLCNDVFGIPLVTIPFNDDFEGVANFYIEGLNNQWQHGVPSASVINTAHSPVNVWATNLTGNYANSSNYNLYSPRISFSNIVNAEIGFWHWYDIETSFDGGRLQYTTNNGNTWQTLGVVGDPLGTNWYTHANINGAPAFSGSSAGWVYSSYNLAQFNNYPVPVQFRFNFFANPSNVANGWAIDDIEIFQNQIAQDGGVIAIVSPTTPVVTGSSETVTVTIKNYGTQALTLVPVRYRVDNGVPVSEQWTGNLAPGATTNFTFTTPLVQTASFDLCAYTKVLNDSYTQNDTTCTHIDIIPAQYDAGITEITVPGSQTTINTPVTVTVKIKNFGSEALSSVDLQYDVNSGTPVTATYTGAIAPGAEVTHTFTQTYMSPSGNYILCAKTTLGNDQNATNDKLCKTVTGTVGIEEDLGNGFALGQNMPNPASGKTVIPYNLPGSGKVNLEIVNVIGQRIFEAEAEQTQGKHKFEIDADKLTDGVYYYTLSFNGQRLTRKMVVSR